MRNSAKILVVPLTVLGVAFSAGFAPGTAGNGNEIRSAPLVVPVTGTSTGPKARNITLYESKLDLAKGQPVLLETGPLRIAKESWGEGGETNVGVATEVICTRNGVTALKAHSVENYTPKEPAVTPKIRAMLIPKESGEHICTLRTRAFSRHWAPGMTARVYGHPALSAVPVDDGETYGQPHGDKGLAPGKTVTALRKKISGVENRNATITADFELSTCNSTRSHGGLCRKRNPGAAGSVVESALDVQGYDSSGTRVGPRYRSATRTRSVTAARHHAMTHHDVTAHFPAGTDHAVVRVSIRVRSGDHMVLHGGYGYARVNVLK